MKQFKSTLVLVAALVTFLPLLLLILGAMVHVGEGRDFSTSTLGSLINSED